MCNNNENCLSELLEKILFLQQNQNSTQEGCNKPFLGDNIINANTRPLNIYSCCTGTIWTMPYNYNSETGNSTTFRIENINDNYATFRILIPTDTGYTATDNFFTIDLKYISCIKCLQDVIINI